MPLLKIQTSTSIADKQQLALEASKKVAEILGKPERYVMVNVNDQQTLTFAGSTEAAAYLELKSINLPESETAQLSTRLCDFINSQLDIDVDRIYIEFSNAPRHLWGWNGATF
ncbi:MAG: phenylpyruvate tautomerase MIF-related protein [Gammaproteobacteria bacterium]|nr:phenylpyruvate tautomerase MIF-related protein [Gammaproteobacteria bacterium]